MLTLDGSAGEGGGQILRTSLGLSLATGTPFRIHKIRAGRPKPGLLRQHLTAVDAAATIGSAEVSGGELGSRELTFRPGPVRPGEYRFAVGSAGSATLVLQAVLPALLTASAPSHLHLEGGTHNPSAPPFDFLSRTFLPLVNRMGPTVTAKLERRGFYPAGGGRFEVHIAPAPLRPIELLERGALVAVRAAAIASSIPAHVARREIDIVMRELKISDGRAEEDVTSPGPGNVVLVEIESAAVTEVVTAFGTRGVKAEAVAHQAVREARAYLESGLPVGEHLADQLMVPLALARGGAYRAGPLSSHSTTNLEVIRQFVDVKVAVTDGRVEFT